jgi:hypothetical protein
MSIDFKDRGKYLKTGLNAGVKHCPVQWALTLEP